MDEVAQMTAVDWSKVERRQRIFSAIFRRDRRRAAFSVATVFAGICLIAWSPIIAYFLADWTDPTLGVVEVLCALGIVTLVGLVASLWSMWRRDGAAKTLTTAAGWTLASVALIALCGTMDTYAPSWWFLAFFGLVMIALTAVLLWERIARRR